MINISVVIPTKGRKEELIQSVESLLSQTRSPLEIIVVDQNEPSNQELDAAFSSIPLIKHFKNKEPGLVKNYNKGLSLARGDVVLFLDDDIIAEKHLIENLITVYEADTERRIAAVAGRVLNARGDLHPSLIKKVGFYNSWTGHATAQFNYNKSCEVEFAQGACMSFRREKLLTLNGFDEGFVGNGYYFETDAGLRICEKGYKIIFDPNCVIEHLMAPRGGARLDKINHTYYFIKNGMRLQKRHSFFFQRPFYVLWTLTYVFMKALYNRSPKLLIYGLKAMVDDIASH